MLGLALVIKPLVYYFFGLYRRMWAYASIPEIKLIVLAVTTASLILAIPMLFVLYGWAFYAFPRSVLIIDWVFPSSWWGGSACLFVYFQRDGKECAFKNAETTKTVLVIGAGMRVPWLSRNYNATRIEYASGRIFG